MLLLMFIPQQCGAYHLQFPLLLSSADVPAPTSLAILYARENGTVTTLVTLTTNFENPNGSECFRHASPATASTTHNMYRLTCAVLAASLSEVTVVLQVTSAGQQCAADHL